MKDEIIFDGPKEGEIYEEFGCSSPISFMTSKGIKRMEPGKIYNFNLDEINQPERLNPEGFYERKNGIYPELKACDSPTTENK